MACSVLRRRGRYEKRRGPGELYEEFHNAIATDGTRNSLFDSWSYDSIQEVIQQCSTRRGLPRKSLRRSFHEEMTLHFQDCPGHSHACPHMV